MEARAKNALILLAVLSGVAGGGYAWYAIRKERRDRKATDFYSRIEATLNPGNVHSNNINNTGPGAMRDMEIQAQQAGRMIDALTESDARERAERLEDSWGWLRIFNDDEDQVYSVYRRLASLYQIGQMSDKYYEMYEVEPLDDIAARMSDSEYETVAEIIAEKPDVTYIQQ